MSMGAAPAGGGRRGRGRPMSEINVTPMVDVMLVLLVIFMITAPSLDKSGIDVKLPQATQGANTSHPTTPLLVVVDRDGRVYTGGKMLEPGEVDAELPKLLKGHEKETLTLKAARELRYDTVVKVIAAVRAAGITGISIAVDHGK